MVGISFSPVRRAQADDPPCQAPVGVDADKGESADHPDGQCTRLAVVQPRIRSLKRWAVKQRYRQVEGQAAFKTVAVALSRIPLEGSFEWWRKDIRQRQIYVNDVVPRWSSRSRRYDGPCIK